MEALIVVFIIIIVIAAVIYGHIQKQKRINELTAWAESHGLHFSADPEYGVEECYPEFSCLKKGSRRYAFNISRGKMNGRGICAFDYHYETYSTNSKGHRQTHHHYFSAVVIDSGLPLKPLFIRPEGFFDKITEFFGYDDIDFESAEFSRKFYVKSPDKRWAFDIVHPETMEFLLDSPTYTLELYNRDVIAYRGKTFAPFEFDEATTLIEGILSRFPEYLLRELKGEE